MSKQEQYSPNAKKIVDSYYNLANKDFQDIDMILEDKKNLDALKEIAEKERKDSYLRETAISAIGFIGAHALDQATTEECIKFLLSLEKKTDDKETLKQIKNSIIHIIEDIGRSKRDIQTTLPEKYKKILEKVKNTEKVCRIDEK